MTVMHEIMLRLRLFYLDDSVFDYRFQSSSLCMTTDARSSLFLEISVYDRKSECRLSKLVVN